MQDPTFTLLVGDEEYPVDELAGWTGPSGFVVLESRRSYVAVTGEPDDATLRVELRRRDAEPRRRAPARSTRAPPSGLYIAGAQPDGAGRAPHERWKPGTSTPAGRRPRRLVSFSCGVRPYVGGLGWAMGNKTWLVVVIDRADNILYHEFPLRP